VTGSTFVIAMRLVLSLAVVLGLLALAARAAKAGGFGGARRAAAPIAILARQGVARSASVVVVRAADRALVLGVTDHTISLLAEVDPSAMETQEAEPARTPVLAGAPYGDPRTPSWRDPLDALRERTVRRP
jgi:flagellar protein FliO/FliZ